MTPILLGLFAALAWGASEYLAGTNARDVPVPRLLGVSLTAGAVVVLPIVAAHGSVRASPLGLAESIGTGVLGVACLGLLYRAMAVGSIAVVAPVAATGAIVPAVWAIVNGERPDVLQSAGLPLAVIGVLLASIEHDGHGGRRVASGLILALASAAVLGVALILFGAASSRDPWTATIWLRLTFCAIGLPILAASFSRDRRQTTDPFSALPAIVAAGLLDAAADLAFALGSSRGLLSLVSILAGLAPVVTLLLTWLILRERPAGIQRYGVIGALIGATLIAGG